MPAMFYITAAVFIVILCIKIDNKENGGQGRIEGRAGKKGKDSPLLEFQNRFGQVPEERVYEKKRSGAAEANINAINWEECPGW